MIRSHCSALVHESATPALLKDYPRAAHDLRPIVLLVYAPKRAECIINSFCCSVLEGAMSRSEWWVWGLAALGAVSACGRSTRWEEEPPETPPPKIADDASAPIQEPSLGVDDFPICAGAREPVLLAQGASGEAGITLDEDDVYYVGYLGVSRVEKAGGAEVILGPADDMTLQIAVDAENVYWGGRAALFRRPKLSGDPVVELSGIDVLGSVARDGYVYFGDWSILPSFLHRWSRDGDHETFVPHNGQLWAPILLADREHLYQMPHQTDASLSLDRVRLRDGQVDALTRATLVFGMALDAGSVYLSSAQTVLRVALEDGTVETLFAFTANDYPTALAVDDRYVYLSLQRLTGSVYHGHLVRFGTDGSEPCVLTTPIAYARGLAVDESSVYYVRDRQLWKIAK